MRQVEAGALSSAGQGFDVRAFAVALLGSFALLVVSLVNFLRFNDYPLARPEVLILAAGLLALALPVALLHQGQRPQGQAMLDWLLVFFVLELNGASTLWAMAGGALVGAIVFVRGRSALSFLGIAAVIACLVSLAGIGSRPPQHGAQAATSPARQPGPKPPFLLHIVLDEHIGVAGLPADNPRSPAMEAALRDFYQGHGFRLYGRAYSEHFHTVNAIPQILNFGATQDPGPTPTAGATLRRSTYFDLLREKGYGLHILQSQFIDYCRAVPVARCEQYDSTRLAVLSRLPIDTDARAGLLAVRFALLSDSLKNLRSLYLVTLYQLRAQGVRLPEMGLPLAGRVDPINALDAFDRLIAELRRARPGEAWFAHLLIPHYPYATAPDCTVRDVGQWMLRRSQAPNAMRENAYFDQINCAVNRLDAALDALAQSPARDDFIVIVHGDHGSRITRIEPIASNSPEDADLIAGFSTLFAVRAAGIAPDYDDEAAPVAALLADFARRDFDEAPVARAGPGATIMLDDVHWRPIRAHPLPEAWRKGP